MVSKTAGGGSAFGLGGRCRRGDVRARVGLGTCHFGEGFSGGFYRRRRCRRGCPGRRRRFFACGGVVGVEVLGGLMPCSVDEMLEAAVVAV